MLRYLASRVLWTAVALLVLVTVVFFALNLLLPYDFSSQFRGDPGVREQLGLDRPLIAQWFTYMSHLVRLDLGDTYGGVPVWDTIARALPVTMVVFGFAGIIAYFAGSWLGRVVAWQRSRVVAGGTTTGTVLLFTAFPPWLVFLLLYLSLDHIALWRYNRGWVVGWEGAPVDRPGEMFHGGAVTQSELLGMLAWALLFVVVVGVGLRMVALRRNWRWFRVLAFPLVAISALLWFTTRGYGELILEVITRPPFALGILALLLIAFGEVMMVTRAGVVSEMEEDYVLTARAKGQVGRRIRDRHIAPNSLLPSLTRFFSSVPYLLTGLIMIERELGLVGLSTVFFAGIEHADIPLVLGTLVVMGGLMLLLRLLLDFIQASIDPRITVSGERP